MLNAFKITSIRNVMQISWQVLRQLSSKSNSHAINDVVIVSAARTPICSFQSRLATLSAPRLGAIAINAAIKRATVPQDAIDDLYMGHALTAGVGQAPARQSAVYANLPTGICCTTVNKVCASGLKAITLAAQTLQLGHAQVALAGGMESMSNVPYYLERGAIPYGGTQLRDGIIYDALYDYCSKIALSQYAEMEAQRLAISQAEMDTYSRMSHARAAKAAQLGAFMDEMVPVQLFKPRKPTESVYEDEELKQGTPEKHGKCAVGALNDGATALLLSTSEKAKELKLMPLARIIDYQDVEMEGTDFATAPVVAVTRMLERNALEPKHISRWEINDDVAILPLAFMKHLSLSHECVNMEGGALALGHPIGMSGARLVTHLVHALEKPGDLGCAAICDGDGGATAIIVEKMKNIYDEQYPRPLLTLYTRNPCPLCDLLVEELQANFGGEYLLEKINLADKHNVRYLRLFRFDIPVVFFNGQFLCMHHLNHILLRRKINAFKEHRLCYKF